MSHRLHPSFRPVAARIGVFGTLAAAAGFVACASPGPQAPVVSTVSNPAIVAIDLRDGNDNHIGSCTGTLVSDRFALAGITYGRIRSIVDRRNAAM